MQWSLLILSVFVTYVNGQAPLPGFRPPSVPLVVIDPFMNIWSIANNLYDIWPRYWDGQLHNFGCIIRVDGDSYNVMGIYNWQANINNVNQRSVTVWPTRTIYEFDDPQQKVHLTVQFTSPLLPQRWDISSRPITYITYTVRSLDGLGHSVQLYHDNTAEVAVNDDSQEVNWRRFQVTNSEVTSTALEIGTTSQNYFDVRGDRVAIDWGYAYTAVIEDSSVSTVITGIWKAQDQFIANGTIPSSDDPSVPDPVNNNWPALIVVWDIALDAANAVSKFVTFAYDDKYSIKYFGDDFRPYWRRPSGFHDIDSLLRAAIADYESLLSDCESFDLQTYQLLRDKGGDEYATLTSITYRQTFAATKLVWNDQLNIPWVFLKEISSGGYISSVDVLTPASPLFLYHDPEYLEYLLLPILAYSNNETGDSPYNYKSPWAPHHLGSYPVADILTNQQEDMPMEETGNMLMVLAAITQQLGIQSTSLWYPQYWSLLKTWADYLVSTLPDPGNQSCSDSFEGPSPHNANLAIKGIVGLGAFSELCKILGLTTDQEYYLNQARSFASQWVDLAIDGDHYKLQYDLNNTWSLKYNLLFEKVLGLSIFPEDVVPTEMAYYLNHHLNTYGIPLDNRATFTKLDWLAWVAGMTNDANQQREIFSLLYNWAHITQPMTPLTDWYDTVGGGSTGFTARPVVGGLYSLMIV